MLRKVDAEKLLLPAQQLASRRLRHLAERRGELSAEDEVAEERDLTRLAVALLPLRRRQHRIEAIQLRLTRLAERCGRAALDQRLQYALVAALEIDAPAEVVERLVASGRFARIDDALDRSLADVLHRAEAEADALWSDREPELGFVDVGREDRDAHAAALRDR